MQIAIRRLAARFVCLALLTTGLFSPARATAFTARDIETISSSYISSFYLVNGTNGYIRDRQSGGIAYFWTQAEMIECVLDAGGTQSLTSPSFLVVGGQGVLNNFLTGDISEVQIHGAALSDADRLNIERALRCQYGLSGGTTPTAPFALSGSATNRQISLNWMLVPGATEYQLSRSTDNGQSYELIASNLTTSSYVDTTAINGEINYYRVTALNSCGAGANSASIGIQLPLPGLVMTTTASDLTLTWPSWASDWILLSATNLTPPALWSPVTNQISSNANGFSVTLPIGTGTEFFRLASP